MQHRDHFAYMLDANFVEAKDIPKMDLNGKADPFCIVKLGEIERGRTRIIKKTRSPVWNETIRIPILESQKNYNLQIGVWDWDKVSGNDFIGTVTVDLATLHDLKEHDEWLAITLKEKSHEKTRGSLHLRLQLRQKADVEREFWSGVFQHFDSDGSGALGMLELSGLLEGIGASMNDDDLARLFKSADENNDGEISYAELLHLATDEHSREDPLKKQLLPTEDILWSICSQAHDGRKVGEIVLQSHGSDMSKSQVLRVSESKPSKELKIMVHNRETGKLEEEKIPNYIRVAMRMMYSTGGGLYVVEGNKIKSILSSLTHKQGKKYNDPESVKEIEHFINYHQLNREEMLNKPSTFNNFNEFFYRKLKPSARPIAAKDDPKVAVSPADCRLHVFVDLKAATELWIKGKNFSLSSFLKDEELAARYEGGSLVIARLAPQDYHRFHFPVGGVVSQPTLIDGTYYTVNPVAVNQSVDVYSENKRVVSTIETREFGTVCYVAIGATMVGSINLTVSPGTTVHKGDEFGYFAFGGSTCILLFEKDRIVFDEDLLVNSQKPLETLVKVGTSLGRATRG